MNRVQAQRLVDLYYLAKDFPAALKPQFDIEYWWRKTYDLDGSCYTVGCIFGWAVNLLPSWKQNISPDARLTTQHFHCNITSSRLESPKDICTTFLGINEYEYKHIFIGASYNMRSYKIKPHHIAPRIRETLESYGWIPFHREAICWKTASAFMRQNARKADKRIEYIKETNLTTANWNL